MGKVYCDDGVCVLDDGSFIEIRNLSLRYGSNVALKEVNLSLNPCSVTAFIGPSGSGKSSLISCLNRMTDHFEGCSVTGSVEIGGKNIFDSDFDTMVLRKKVGMIFQKPNPFPMSVRKNIEMPLKYHGITSAKERDQLVEQALTEVGLWDEVKDRLNESALKLSGGQQQRLCIARAIVLKPEVLLMDEPCSALDPMAMSRIEDLILSLRKKMTVLVVTHNLAQARRIADQTVVIWNQNGSGEVIDHGDTERIFCKPANEVVAAYLSGSIG